MTIAEALAEGGRTAVIGLTTVFAVLIILMIVITIMKMMFYKDPSKSAAVQTPAAPAPAPVVPEAPAAPKADEMDDEELVAVITAAIAASLNTSTYNLRIKSLRRIDNKQPAWNRAGIRETINNRF